MRSRSRWGLLVVLVVLLLAFMSRHRYDVIGDSTGSTLFRTNRFSGRSERLDGDRGWVPMGGSAPRPRGTAYSVRWVEGVER